MKKFSRRGFLAASGGAAIGAGLGSGCETTPEPVTVAAAARKPDRPHTVGPNDIINVGVIGVAGRGMSHVQWLNAQQDVRITVLCDVYPRHLEQAVANTPSKPRGYKDYRRMLEEKELDAVFIATPPHWHPLMTIDACQAGKDVYCEKPMALTPAESRAMVKTARSCKRVTQIGTQIHAGENYHRAVEIVRSGILGKISCVRTMLTLNEAPDGLGNVPDEPPPEGLDWDLWCGPLPLRPYNPALFVGGHHRYFADLVGSWLHEMGPHIIDLPVWALELGPPKTAFAAGGKFVTNDISTIPDTMEAVFEYDDFVLTWSNQCANSHGLAFHKPGKDQIQRRLGVSFHGVNGTLLADYDEYWLVSEGSRIKDPVLPEPYLPRVSEHPREFLDCIRTRELPSCDVEEHYPLAVLLNLGNIAYKVGRKIRWDAENERIIGDREADELATPKYREPWKLPV